VQDLFLRYFFDGGFIVMLMWLNVLRRFRADSMAVEMGQRFMKISCAIYGMALLLRFGRQKGTFGSITK
jgi:hypothetical protein